MQKEELLQKLSDYVFDMEDEEICEVTQEYIDAGFDPQEGILEGLVDGMRRASEMYEQGEYFVPELINCSDAMYASMEMLQNAMPGSQEYIGKAVIGVVQGDTHDIGKNLVKIMMEGCGLEVIDLGVDVPPEQFVATALEQSCDIIACSSLLTTTMNEMRRVVQLAEEKGIRQKVKIMVGGAPITQSFCDEIGADAYTDDAGQAARVAASLLESA